MDRKTIVRCVILQLLILALSCLAFAVYGLKWAVIFFAVCECTSIIVIGAAAYRNYRSSSRFISKQSLEQADDSLSAADMHDWVQFSNSLSEGKSVAEEPSDIQSEDDLMGQAEKEWLQLRRTKRGAAQYNRILSNWKVYIATCALNKKLTVDKKCQLEIIRFMLTNNASIKKQEAILAFCEKNDRDKETALQAMDQLLIQKVIIIAIEGSLEYYRINLGWKILEDINNAKQILINQSKDEETDKAKADRKLKTTEKHLPKTTIGKSEKEEINQTAIYYRKLIKEQVIYCLQHEEKPISFVDLLANHKELKTVNQLTLKEMMKELVQDGKIICYDNEHPAVFTLATE